MLASLRIQNLALVERLDWDLPKGFVAITGETGSGKSIIIGALKLVLGERADKTLIRSGAESCTVEAVFHLDDTAVLDAVLEEQGIDPCTDGELILKRTFTSTGTNRQWINCGATTLAVLRNAADALVDLHGPHEHQSLLSVEKQLELLDTFAGAEKLRANYSEHYRRLQKLEADREELSASEASLDRERELLAHQTQEIESAKLDPDEEEQLLARYHVARNGHRVLELSTQIVQLLAEADDAALARLGEAQRLFRELERCDPSQSPLAAEYAGVVSQLDEIARGIRDYASRVDLDPAQLAAIEERVTLIETLKRKYGRDVSEVIAFGAAARERLNRIESRGELLAQIETGIAAESRALTAAGAALSKARREAAPRLAKNVRAQLADLGFRKSELEITLTPGKPLATGMETVEFQFAPNPGEPARPLRSIASSGEISRVMLAIKTALADQDDVPLLVFDEIDANIGGEIAHAVGAKMRELGRKHQVLCITHLAQVAARADAQFVVAKASERQRTISTLTPVNDDARLAEIARMLGGGGPSALAHAKTLVGA
jgi:DNA repair protein RecN (Recombination protein N)